MLRVHAVFRPADGSAPVEREVDVEGVIVDNCAMIPVASVYEALRAVRYHSAVPSVSLAGSDVFARKAPVLSRQ